MTLRIGGARAIAGMSRIDTQGIPSLLDHGSGLTEPLEWQAGARVQVQTPGGQGSLGSPSGRARMKLNRILVYHPERVGSIFHHRGCSILQLNSAEPRGSRLIAFLIMPSDPDNLQVGFPNDFWEWWQSPPTDPFGDSITSFGSYHRPGADAAITCESDYRTSDFWREYISLSRAEEFEFGLTTSGADSVRERRCFFLTNIVGRIWVAVSRYGPIVQKFSLVPRRSKRTLPRPKDRW